MPVEMLVWNYGYHWIEPSDNELPLVISHLSQSQFRSRQVLERESSIPEGQTGDENAAHKFVDVPVSLKTSSSPVHIHNHSCIQHLRP